MTLALRKERVPGWMTNDSSQDGGIIRTPLNTQDVHVLTQRVSYCGRRGSTDLMHTTLMYVELTALRLRVK